MSNGWISLHRKVMDHPLYKEKRTFSKFEAWIDLLMLANHKDNKFLLGNELVEVESGSFITSELKLMERWGWGKSKTRSFLELLEKDGMIVKKSDRKKTTINICNYCVYQESENKNRPQADHKQTASRPIADTNNNDNKDNKKTLSIQQAEQFDSWWNLYGKKEGTAKCKVKFMKLLKTYDYSVIEEGTKKYLQHRANLSSRNEFVPNQKNPLTFLNGEHFNDEYGTTKASNPNGQAPIYKPFVFDVSRGED